MAAIQDFMGLYLGIGDASMGKLVWSSLIVVGLVAIRSLVLRLMHRHVDDSARYYRWRRFITTVMSVLALVSVALIWFQQGFSTITNFIALVSAGLAIAMHDTVSNLTGWLFILWRRPFQVGDRIEIDKVIGDVIDIRLFQFSMIEVGGGGRIGAEQSTGRILHVPNGKVLREVLANYDLGFRYIWDELPILVTFESDWRKAKELVTEIVQRHAEPFSADAEAEMRKASRRYLIHTGKVTPIVYTSIADAGVLLTLRYIIQPRRRRGVQEAISEDILDAFNAAGNIDLAYPTTRFYNHSNEGKPELSGRGQR